MLMTGEQYIESLRKMKTRVYMFGEKIDNWVDHPIIRPSIDCVKVTYDLAQDPQYADLMTAKSNLTGEIVNRFGHLHQSADDLRKKVKMQRLCGQKTASCFQRCVGMDAFNAVFSTTFEVDKKYGTHYHENFKNFLTKVQNEDLVVDGAMTDPKGDRGLAPHLQKDPDLFVHIVEKREDGIVVRGAKAHQTGTINSHWHLVMPTQAMGEADKAYAVSFACPSDAEGMFMIYGRQSCDTRKLEDGADVDLGNKKFGGQEALVVFDNVFIPNDCIFLCEEYDFAGMLVERFAGYHRQSYGGCKVGVGDVIIGAAALAADYNGAQKASHIKDKLIEMTHLNETLYCCGIACSAEGYPTEAGNYQIGWLQNIGIYINVAVFVVLSTDYLASYLGLNNLQSYICKIIIIGVFTWINLRGVKDVAIVSSIISGAILVAFAGIAIIGFIHFSHNPFEPVVATGGTVSTDG